MFDRAGIFFERQCSFPLSPLVPNKSIVQKQRSLRKKWRGEQTPNHDSAGHSLINSISPAGAQTEKNCIDA